MTTTQLDLAPLDHNGECRYCDEQLGHRSDCPWLLRLIATYTETRVEVVSVRRQLTECGAEKRQQLALLLKIRRLCDETTGIDVDKGGRREPGALGAVKALVGRYKELLDG